MFLFHTEIDKLWEVEVRSLNFDAQAEITMNIYTEHWRGGPDTDIAGHYAVEGDTIEQLESYQMPNGATAEIVMETWSGEHQNRQCYGHFIRHGVLYDVMVNGGLDTQEEMVSRLKDILDSFA